MTTQTDFQAEFARQKAWLMAIGLVFFGALVLIVFRLFYVPSPEVVIALGVWVFVFFIGTTAWRDYSNRKFEEEFWRLSQQLGLDLGRFQLFAQSNFPLLTPIKRGKLNGIDLTAFHYQHTVRIGKREKTTSQTVVWMHHRKAMITDFRIQPEGRWLHTDVSALLFGSDDINFESHPEFSRMYLLRGLDEAAIRQLFNTDVLDFFEAHPGLNVEAADNKLIYYQSDVRVPANEVTAFVKEARELLTRFGTPSNSDR